MSQQYVDCGATNYINFVLLQYIRNNTCVYVRVEKTILILIQLIGYDT